jgi:anti-sigma factor RsiW
MSTNADMPEIRADELRDLSALADGTLDPARRAEVEARIAASPELSERYAREQRVVEMLHQARTHDRAPASLRARIAAQRPKCAVAARRRIGYAGGLVTALAVAALAIVLALPGGAPGAPSLSEAAAIAIRGPAMAAPPIDADQPGKLQTLFQGIYFPDWTKFHWRASGQRFDRIHGRAAITVYYDWKGHRIAYTIVGAPTLKTPNAEVRTLKGVDLRTLKIGGRTVVTWTESNHTCVLSATGVPAEKLQGLAAWEGSGA